MILGHNGHGRGWQQTVHTQRSWREHSGRGAVRAVGQEVTCTHGTFVTALLENHLWAVGDKVTPGL